MCRVGRLALSARRLTMYGWFAVAWSAIGLLAATLAVLGAVTHAWRARVDRMERLLIEQIDAQIARIDAQTARIDALH